MIDAREQMKFEKWMKDNYPGTLNYWENETSEYIDLDDYVKNNCSIIWRNWLEEKDEWNEN